MRYVGQWLQRWEMSDDRQIAATPRTRTVRPTQMPGWCARPACTCATDYTALCCAGRRAPSMQAVASARALTAIMTRVISPPPRTGRHSLAPPRRAHGRRWEQVLRPSFPPFFPSTPATIPAQAEHAPRPPRNMEARRPRRSPLVRVAPGRSQIHPNARFAAPGSPLAYGGEIRDCFPLRYRHCRDVTERGRASGCAPARWP
jgi:hypothetical protein